MSNDSPSELSKKNCQSNLLPLLITTGEPAGIGMDIVLQLAKQGAFDKLNRKVIVLADETVLQQRISRIYGVQDKETYQSMWQRIAKFSDFFKTEKFLKHPNPQTTKNKIKGSLLDNVKTLPSTQFYLIHVPCASPVVAGELNTDNAQMVIAQLQLAHELAYADYISAIVTGPLQKSILIDAGLTLNDGTMFTGHTEFFMQKSGCDKVVMMLANTAMKVALVTTHLALREVADAITPQNVRQTVQIVLKDLKTKFGLDNPRLLVCGLNPHAGEDGHLGMEEIEIINPVLHEFQDKGYNISSAMPADTLFTTRHLQNCDAVIAMYHDQGLPVLKSHGFGDTVNLTLGLPYIRTSVDHGTALDLAGRAEGSEQASSSSMWQAIKMVDDMATSKAMLH